MSPKIPKKVSKSLPLRRGDSLPSADYYKATLDNGVILVAEKHSHVRSLSIGVWVKIGSSFESPQQNGVSHFIEHMVFKGTQKRTPLEIATVLESLGGDLNAFTDREYTCYHATVLNEHLEVALDVLSDLLLRPTFPKQELERERKVLLQELSMIEESPDDLIGDLFFETVWKDEPLGKPIIGSKKNILALSRNQLLGYFEEHYCAENIVISVAGNLDFEDLRRKCETYFKFEPSQKSLPIHRARPKFHARKKTVVQNTEQIHLLLGYDAISFRDPYRFDALILSFFLGGGMSSRLFQEIREKAGLAYSVECDFLPFSEAGLFTIYVGMAHRSLGQCVDIIGREISRLKSKPLEAKDLEVVKGQLKGAILLSSDQMETRQESLGRNELVFGRYVSVDEVIGEIQQVTPERIHALANRMFVKEKEAAVTVGKSKPKASVLKVC